MKKQVIIKLNQDNHRIAYRSFVLHTLYGDIRVPKSCVLYVADDVIMVAAFYFDNKGINPCQMVSGFIGMEA